MDAEGGQPGKRTKGRLGEEREDYRKTSRGTMRGASTQKQTTLPFAKSKIKTGRKRSRLRAQRVSRGSARDTVGEKRHEQEQRYNNGQNRSRMEQGGRRRRRREEGKKKENE